MSRPIELDPSPPAVGQDRRRQSLVQKFRTAARGLKLGVGRERNFVIHFFIAALVGLMALLLSATLVECCLLALCVALVLGVELCNTALEIMARTITDNFDPRVRDALDVSSAAVLVSAIGASVVGTIIFVHRLAVWWSG